MSEIRIGISGWRYGPCRKDFYPSGLCHDDELAFASQANNSIEIKRVLYNSHHLLAKLVFDGELVTEPGVAPQEVR